jgi:hypothetical protein
MALVPCPECQKEVSTQALACPQCAFPFPGKHGHAEGSQSKKLSPCPDCGCLVSKQARSCPHCGVARIDEQVPQTTNGKVNEETWLCPHCGTSYTRKVNKEEKLIVGHQVLPSITEERSMDRPLGLGPNKTREDDFSDLLRKQSPLWQDASFSKKMDYDTVSRRYPRSRKKSIVVGLIIFVFVAASIALGALWKLQGLNPLEALVYWRM